MRALAYAIVRAVTFLGLSESELDEDDVVSGLEDISAALLECTASEKAALRAVVEAEYASAQADGAPESVLEFYRDFMSSVGLE